MYRKPDGTPDDLAMMKDVKNWAFHIPTLAGEVSILPIKRSSGGYSLAHCAMVVHIGTIMFFVDKTLGDPIKQEDLTVETTPEKLIADGWVVD